MATMATTTTKTDAMKQATEDVTMYRQGGGWVVSTYDPKVNAKRVSHEMPYSLAREHLTRARAERAVELMGIDPYDPDTSVAYDIQATPGSLRQRVNRALAAL